MTRGLSIRVDASDLNRLDAWGRGIAKRLATERRRALFRVVKVVGENWRSNFANEGGLNEVWAPLADATVQRRLELGYGGEHPILMRESALFHISTVWFVDYAAAANDGSFSSTDKYGTTTSSEMKVTNRAAFLSISGPKVSNQYKSNNHPARPFWYTDNAIVYDAVGEVEDWIISDVLRPV